MKKIHTITNLLRTKGCLRQQDANWTPHNGAIESAQELQQVPKQLQQSMQSLNEAGEAEQMRLSRHSR
jgi:hypothetical protein